MSEEGKTGKKYQLLERPQGSADGIGKDVVVHPYLEEDVSVTGHQVHPMYELAVWAAEPLLDFHRMAGRQSGHSREALQTNRLCWLFACYW